MISQLPFLSSWADLLGAGAALMLAGVLLLVGRLRRSVRLALQSQEETLQRIKQQAAQLSTRLVHAERSSPESSPLVGMMTRRVGTIDALALAIGGELDEALRDGHPVRVKAAAELAVRRGRQVQYLAEGGRAREQQVSLHALWPRVPALLGAQLSGQTMSVRVAADLPPVVGAGQTWVQVLCALVENAAESSPAGGMITVTAAVSGEDAMRIRVEDRGRGIPEDLLPRITEPSYSTRGERAESSLGLAMVSTLVEGMGGSLQLSSKVGEGTRVEIVVPLAGHDAAARSPLHLEGTVLLADDSRDVRAGTRRILERLGLEVVEADSGSAARTAITSEPARFRAAIIDVVMPGAPVDEVVAQARRHRPDLPVLLVSGYDTMKMVDGLLAMGGVRFLPKPFTASDLARTLDDLLAGARLN